ncbi:MAG: two-component system CitB family response regulator [Urechidicola sp.]|jgi:two-component system CitB family response regulator
MTAIRTIIAEDDERIAEIQRRFLDKVEGYEVIGIAHNMTDCREMSDILEPDLILLDIQFPDGNGLEFLKSLRESDKTVDVILVTAAKDVNSLKDAMHGGVFDYIVKPMEFNRLRHSLDRFRNHFNKINTLETLEQSDIDGLMPGVKGVYADNKEDSLPKGIDSITLTKVRELFHTNPASLSADLVGQDIGVCRTTARRYLEFLVGTRELAVDVSYGGVGRPERHYCQS